MQNTDFGKHGLSVIEWYDHGTVEFDVQPTYGWGWDSKGQVVEVPTSFRIHAVVNEKSGFQTAMPFPHSGD